MILAVALLTGCSQQPQDSPTLPAQTEKEEVLELTSEIETEEPTIETEQTETEIIEETQEEVLNDTVEEEITAINASEKEIEVLRLINEERQRNGLNSLEWDPTLYKTAKIRSEEASHYWSHTRPDGTHWSVLSSELQGENLAKGYYNADETFNAWMNSEGHKANMLRAAFTRAAVSFYEAPNGWFWCLHFGY